MTDVSHRADPHLEQMRRARKGPLEKQLFTVYDALSPHFATAAGDPDRIRTADVDGAFFWNVVHTAFPRELRRLQLDRRFANPPSTPQQRLDLDKELRNLHREFGLPEFAVLASLYGGAIPHLREAEIRRHTNEFSEFLGRLRETDDRITIDVRSSDWTGADVANRFEWFSGLKHFGVSAFLELPQRQLDVRRPKELITARVTVTHRITVATPIEFEPVYEGSGTRRSTDRLMSVRVHIYLDYGLPSLSMLRSLYDEHVIGRLGWHRMLPGAADSQQPETAARTWLVALLIARGRYTASDALSAVKLGTGLPGTTVSNFRRDHELLAARVPEAIGMLPKAKRGRPPKRITAR